MRLIKNLLNQTLLLIFSLNLFLRIQLNWPLGSSISTPDSISYRPSPPGPQTFPYEGQVALEKLSEINFFGNSLRPWPINLIFQTISNDQFITFFSIFIGALSWSYLIFTISKLFNSLLFKFISGSVVLVFSLTIYVYSWDKFILSEPIVNSLFIFFIAILLNKWYKKISFSMDIILIILWFIITICRPIFGLVLIPLLFIKEIKIKRYLYLKIFIVALLSAYVILINQKSSEKWLELMGSPREGLTFAHLSANEFEYNSLFISFAEKKGAPKCLNVPEKNSGIWNWARSYKENCPEGVLWLQNEFTSNYLLFLLNPEIFYKFVIEKSPQTMSGVDFRVFYPYQVNKVSNINNFLTNILWKNSKIIFYFKLIIFLFFMFWTILIKNKILNFALLSTLLLSFLGSLFQTAFMPTDYERLGLPGSFIFNLFPVIFMLLFFESLPRFIQLIRK